MKTGWRPYALLALSIPFLDNDFGILLEASSNNTVAANRLERSREPTQIEI